MGCCMFLCRVTGSRVTWTPYFLVIYICICIFCMYLYFFVFGFLGHDFLEGLRPQYTPCLHSLDVPLQGCKAAHRFLLKECRSPC